MAWEDAEREKLEFSLGILKRMYEGWGLGLRDWVVVDEFAYVLQGYEVLGEEVRSCHLDTYVNVAKLVWTASGERSVVPPRGSVYLEGYCNFMTRTGYGLDILATSLNDSILCQPMVDYLLSDGGAVQLMEVKVMTEQFWQKTLMHYQKSDVGPEKVREWIAKLGLIERAALRKEDEQLAERCRDMLARAREKWGGLAK